MFCSFTAAQAIGLAAWGGFNIPSSGTVTASTFGLSDSSNLTISKGGLSAGATSLPGFGPIQLGVGAALLPFQSFTLKAVPCQVFLVTQRLRQTYLSTVS